MSALSENKSLKNWLLLVILSYTVFIFNTTWVRSYRFTFRHSSRFWHERGQRQYTHLGLCGICSRYVFAVGYHNRPLRFPKDTAFRYSWFHDQPLPFIRGFQLYRTSYFEVGGCMFPRHILVYSFAACGTHCPQGQERNCSWHDNYRHFACYDSRYAAGARYRPSPWMEVYIRRYRHCGTVGISAAGVPFSACAQQTKHFGEEPAVAVQIAGNNGHIHFHIARCNCALHRIQLHWTILETSCRSFG